MTLNGCSKKLCPMQVGVVDNCNLTKEQCPYFTQDIDFQKVLKLIKAEVARDIITEIADFIWQGESEKMNFPFDNRYYNKQEFIAELKKKYTEVKE